MAVRAQIRIVAVGRLREPFWKAAQEEYLKRLTGYTTRIEVVEIADEPTPDTASPAQEETIRLREGERLLAKIAERDYLIALDGSHGKSFTSPAFAAHLETLAAQGEVSAFIFVIGGSLGLHETVRQRANLLISFGAFTYPHQLMRVILLEQLYRAAKISRGESYHK